MITAILITKSALRDVLVSFVSGVRETNSTDQAIFYQKNNFIFAFSETISTEELFQTTIEEYQPEKIFIAETGRSIDVDHEIGDIILPNVFLEFNEKILTTEITNENRDSLMGKAEFLEIFDEQKDYFVEDFGLSIGGIIVGNTPSDADAEKLLMAYEADIYSEKNFSEIAKLTKNELVPTITIIGIENGKLGTRHALRDPFHLVAENIMTTIRLLNDEE